MINDLLELGHCGAAVVQHQVSRAAHVNAAQDFVKQLWIAVGGCVTGSYRT